MSNVVYIGPIADLQIHYSKVMFNIINNEKLSPNKDSYSIMSKTILLGGRAISVPVLVKKAISSGNGELTIDHINQMVNNHLRKTIINLQNQQENKET